LKIQILEEEAIVIKDFDINIESSETSFGNSLKEEKSS
jgi:hypothetical protein